MKVHKGHRHLPAGGLHAPVTACSMPFPLVPWSLLCLNSQEAPTLQRKWWRRNLPPKAGRGLIPVPCQCHLLKCKTSDFSSPAWPPPPILLPTMLSGFPLNIPVFLQARQENCTPAIWTSNPSVKTSRCSGFPDPKGLICITHRDPPSDSLMLLKGGKLNLNHKSRQGNFTLTCVASHLISVKKKKKKKSRSNQ